MLMLMLQWWKRIRVWLWRRWLCLGAILVSIGIGAAVWATASWIVPLGPAPVGEGLVFSTLVVDRGGNLLRPYTTPEGRWRIAATREDVDPRFLDLLFAYEDKRFASHHGIDPLALGRALVQLIIHRRIISGGSTISMQVARLLEPRAERSFSAKLRQMVRAVELERSLSKEAILSLYLSLAPYGGNLEGIRAASLAYFGKEPRRLRSAKQLCWWACRNHRSSAVRIARAKRRGAHVTARSTASPRRADRGRGNRAGKRRAGAEGASPDAAPCSAHGGCGCCRGTGAQRSPPQHRWLVAE